MAGSPVRATGVPAADPVTAKGLRNTATATVTALLIGLIRAVIGVGREGG